MVFKYFIGYGGGIIATFPVSRSSPAAAAVSEWAAVLVLWAEEAGKTDCVNL